MRGALPRLLSIGIGIASPRESRALSPVNQTG